MPPVLSLSLIKELLAGNTSSTSLAADLEYYAKRTDINGPASKVLDTGCAKISILIISIALHMQ